ncbi:GNAT family N-acetyltransferase [Ruminococcaceae bacterium AM07-15]|nr:GNAT family N-acetyltransferase [Ruminococcaceae bacterium AM07-15]
MELRAITEQNYQKILDLSTGAGQEEFVAQNVRSLAQAWVFRDRARPYALYEGEEPVGFIMFDWRPEKKWVEIWRLMIDHRFQGKGYGRAAVQKALEFLRESGLFDKVQINYVEENQGAKHLYRSMGFQETGAMEGNEVVMEMDLTGESK